MTILVDMDDTIEQLLKEWIRSVNEKFGRSAAVDEVKSWNVAAVYPGLSWEDVYMVTVEPGFWGRVEPIPGAAEGLKKLMDRGHDVMIVTATYYESVPEKMRDLLFKYFPFLSWDQVIITSRKQLIKGDVLIDDGIHNLEGGDYAKVLMTAPHNQHYDAEANGMIRVHHWTEIEEVIARLDAQCKQNQGSSNNSL